MNNIEQERKEFERVLISKNFNLTDKEVVEKALALEKIIKNSCRL